MKTLTLPFNLKNNDSDLINLHYYHSDKESIKQQINLTKNIFSFLIKGQKEVFTDNSSFLIDKSSFLIMKSGHCLMTEKLATLNKNYKSMLFFFSNEDVLLFVQKFKINTSQKILPKSAYSFQYDQFIRNYVDSLIDISKLSSRFQQKIMQIKFEEIMLYLVENKGIDFINSLISHQNNTIQNFLNVIEANKLKRMTLSELAFLSNMSLSTFKREFEKQFNESPSKWFSNKRLEHAAFILKNSTKRPSEIYEEIGYENLSNFINAFRIKFGITPKQFQSN